MIRSDRNEREFDSYVESLNRPGMTAQEVLIGNDLPLPVTFDDIGTKTTYSRFFQAAAVAGLTTSTITTQVVSETGFTVQNIEVGGENKATFKVYVNNVLIALKRTYYMNYNESFPFSNMPLAMTDVLRIDVTNDSNSVADFETRIVGYKD